MSKRELKLNGHPDTYGFLYGDVVNVMPPVAHWSGELKLEDYEPHDTDWLLYIDGEEVARVREREDICEELTKLLLADWRHDQGRRTFTGLFYRLPPSTIIRDVETILPEPPFSDCGKMHNPAWPTFFCLTPPEAFFRPDRRH